MRFAYEIAGEKYRVEIVPGMTIGRAKGNKIIIFDETVSRHHARIVRVFDVFYIEDTNSENGVYVDGKRIEKTAELKPRMTVKIGGVEIKVENER